MSFRFDATLKEMVRVAAADYAALAGVPDDGSAHLLNVDLSMLSIATDAVIGIGDPLSEIVDLNFQSGPDERLPERVLLYNAALPYRYGVPVRSVVMLLSPKANHRNLSGVMASGDGDHRLEFHYEVVRVWQKPAETYLNGPIGLLPMGAISKLDSELPATVAASTVLKQIEERLHRELSPELARLLLEAAGILAGIRFDYDELRKIARGANLMIESSIFTMYEKLGEVKALRRVLVNRGSRRMGQPDDATLAKLDERINSLRLSEQPIFLDRILNNVDQIATWDDLLQAD